VAHLPRPGQFDAVLWTQDADFSGIPGVRYVAKGSAG